MVKLQNSLPQDALEAKKIHKIKIESNILLEGKGTNTS